MISKGNHVKFARSVLLAVSEEAKAWSTSRFASLTEQDIEKVVKTRSHKHKKVNEGGKEAVADYVKAKKPREPEEKKELAQTLKTFSVGARKKGFIQCICLILFLWYPE